METLQKLQSRVTAMLKLYTALKSDKAQLEKQVAEQAGQIQKQQAEILRLEGELKTMALQQAGDALQSGQKAYFKQQIDQVITELDKNLDLLK